MKTGTSGVCWEVHVAIATIMLSSSAVFADTGMRKTDEGIVVEVASGETATWADLFNASGLTASDCNGLMLIKTGGGAFHPDGTGVKDVGIKGVTIRGGSYHATADAELGAATGKVSVMNDATLVLDGGDDNIKSREVTLASTGSATDYPALRLEGSHWDKMEEVTWKLDSDAAMYIDGVNELGVFRYSVVNANGHTLTLDGLPGAGYRFHPGTRWQGGGTVMVAEEVAISTGSNSGTWWIFNVEGETPTFKFAAGASFTPDSADSFALIKKIVCAEDVIIEAGGETPVAAELTDLTGCPSLSSGMSGLTLNGSWGISSADLLDGRALTVANTLAFGNCCTVSVSDVSAVLLNYAVGKELTIATASRIDGTPSLVGDASLFFDMQNTGTALKLVSKAGSGPFVSLSDDWGVRSGAEHAEANALAVSGIVGQVEDCTTVLVPKGEYWFGESVDLTSLTATGVTFCGIGKADAAVFHSPFAIGSSEDLTLARLTVEGTDGPAVTATGTDGLALRDIRTVDVVGSWSDGNAYPFAFSNVTDLHVEGCAHVFEESPLWSAQAYLSGGAQSADSEVQSGVFSVMVPANTTQTWESVAAASGLKSDAYGGLRLVKLGEGLFNPDGPAIQTAGITGVTIREGRYVSSSDKEFGVGGGSVEICAGATLILDSSYQNVYARKITVAGAGSSPEYPAIRSEYNYVGKCDNISWVLNDDAVFYNAVSAAGMTGDYAECEFFRYSTVVANGHSLTLNGVAGSTYCFRIGTRWNGGGKLIVGDGVVLKSTPKAGNWDFRIESGETPEFEFRGSSTFAPDGTDIFGIAKRLVFSSSSHFAPAGPVDVVLENLSGAPSVSENVTSIRIDGTYSLLHEEAVAGIFLDLPGQLIFGSSAVIDVDSAENLFGKTAFHSAAGVTGRPSPSETIRAANMQVRPVSAGTWAFCGTGFVIKVR